LVGVFGVWVGGIVIKEAFCARRIRYACMQVPLDLYARGRGSSAAKAAEPIPVKAHPCPPSMARLAKYVAPSI